MRDVKIDLLKFNLLPNRVIENFWDALWLGIRPILCQESRQESHQESAQEAPQESCQESVQESSATRWLRGATRWLRIIRESGNSQIAGYIRPSDSWPVSGGDLGNGR